MKKTTKLLLLAVMFIQLDVVAQNCSVTTSLSVQITPNVTLSGYKFNTGCLANSGEIDLKVDPIATYTYQWSNNKTTQDIKNLVAATYTVTVTGASGCTKTASFVVSSATIAPEPQFVRGTTACNPNTMTLRWEGLTTGSFEIRYRLTTATAYTNVGNVGNVEAYNILGLQSNKSYLFQVRYVCPNGTTKSVYKGTTKKTANCIGGGGTNENLAQMQPTNALTASPNPANNFVELAYTDQYSATIETIVTDMTGRVMFRSQSQYAEGLANWTLDVNQWPNGIYQAIVQSPSGSTHTSFIVQR